MLVAVVVGLVYVAAFVNPALVPASMRPATSTPTPTLTPLGPTTPSPTDLVLMTDTATATPSATATRPAQDPTLPPTLTSTPGDIRTPARTPIETDLPTHRPIGTTLTPTPTPTPTLTPSPFRYTIQAEYPHYVPYPGGCQWMGFSGQVLDLNGQLVIDVVVHIGGVDYLTLSGASLEYGIRGWVQKVADQPASTQGYYTVQLQDALGNPLSAAIPLTTTASCGQNLVLINFIQNH